MREEDWGILLVGMICWYLGYKIGRRTGRNDLLQELERAMRILNLKE